MITSTNDHPYLNVGEQWYSSALKFNETDYRIRLSASSTNGLHVEQIQVRICTDGSCTMYDIKPEAGNFTSLLD